MSGNCKITFGSTGTCPLGTYGCAETHGSELAPPSGSAYKFLVFKEGVCPECQIEYVQTEKSKMTVDAWAKRHAEATGHDVDIQELHQVSVGPNSEVRRGANDKTL